MPGDQFNGLALRIQQCGDLDKPLFVGEVGLRPVDVGGSYDSRVASLRAKLQAQRAAGIVGHLVWNWGPGPRAARRVTTSVPGDQVRELLAYGPAFADPVDTRRLRLGGADHHADSPTAPLYTLNEPVTAVVLLHASAAAPASRPASGPTPTARPSHLGGRPLHVHGHVDRQPRATIARLDRVRRHRGRRRRRRSRRVPRPSRTDPGGVGATGRRPDPDERPVHRRPPARHAGRDRPSPAEHRRPERLRDPGQRGRHRPRRGDPPGDDPIVITFVVDSSTGANPATITVVPNERRLDDRHRAAVRRAAPGRRPRPVSRRSVGGRTGSDVLVTVYTTQEPHRSGWS